MIALISSHSASLLASTETSRSTSLLSFQARLMADFSVSPQFSFLGC